MLNKLSLGVTCLLFVTLLVTACNDDGRPAPGQEFATAPPVVATVAPTLRPVPTVATVEVEPTLPTAPTVASVESTPTPTATIAPTATAVPAPTTTPTAARHFADRVWQTAVWLAEELSPRESATDEELAAAMFLADEFSELGYEVGLQSFDAVSLFDVSRLAVLTPGVAFTDAPDDPPRPVDAWLFALPLDPASFDPEEHIVRGEFVYVGDGGESAMAGVDLRNKIALIDNGWDNGGQNGLSLADTVDRAAEAGAAAAVVVRSTDFLERIPRDMDIPAIAILTNQAPGLVRALNAGTVIEVEVVSLELDPQPSRNLIAELKNDIDGDRVLIIGAHYDTTPGSPGANDNGTGVAAALLLAEELADATLPFDLRFVLFGAEETGLNGSFHYVEALGEAETSRILAMINMDSIGTGTISAIASRAMASGGMLDLAQEAADDLGIRLSLEQDFGELGSDHLPFRYAGVDVLVLYADELSYINTPLDTIDHLDPVPMGQAAAMALAVVERLVERQSEEHATPASAN